MKSTKEVLDSIRAWNQRHYPAPLAPVTKLEKALRVAVEGLEKIAAIKCGCLNPECEQAVSATSLTPITHILNGEKDNHDP